MSNLKTKPTATRVAVVDLRQSPDGTDIVLSSGRVTTVHDTPNLALARTWANTTRRVSRVEIDMSGPTPHAVVHGIGHRLPFARRVPLDLALGFTALGTLTSADLGEP